MAENPNYRNSNGKYLPNDPLKLERPLNHIEMTYNLELIGKTIQGYKVMGTGADGSLDLVNDVNKTIKIHRVVSGDSDLISNGAIEGEYVWLVDNYTGGSASSLSGTVTGHLIPDQDVTYDLGSASNKFRDLYLSNNTLYLGENTISITDGLLSINGLPLSADELLGDDIESIIQNMLDTVDLTESLASDVSSIMDEATASIEANITSANDSVDSRHSEISSEITGTKSSIEDSVSVLENRLAGDISDTNSIAELVSSTLDNTTQSINSLISDTDDNINSIAELTSTEFLQVNGSIETRVSGLQDYLNGEISDGNFVLDQKIDSVSATLSDDITSAEANIRQDINALVTSSEAFAQLSTSVETAFSTASSETVAGLESISSFLADEDEAILTETRSLNAAISTELTNTNISLNTNTTAIATADAALIELEESLLAEISSESALSSADITSLLQVTVSADEVVISETRALTAVISNELGQTNAGISSDIIILATEDTALSNRINSLTATISNDTVETNAAINSAETALATEDSALATRITDLTATVSGDKLATNANISSVETAYADADSAAINQASSLIAQLRSDELTVTASIETNLTALVDEDAAMLERVETLTTQISTDKVANEASLSSIETVYTTEDEALATRIDTLTASVSTEDVATDASLSSIETAYANEDTALSTRITDLTATVSGDKLLTDAAISTAETAYATEDEALSTRITDLTATVSGDKLLADANISSVETAYAGEDTALSTRITDLTASVSGEIVATNAAINSAETALATEDAALSTRINELSASFTGSGVVTQADITSIETAYASEDSALTEKINNLTATVSNESVETAANINTVETALALEDSALAERITDLTATVSGDKLLTDAAISTAETTLAAEDLALATRITDLTATVSGEILATAAAINSAETAYADEDTALAGRITDLTATVSGDKLLTDAAISTAETTLAAEDLALAGIIDSLTATVSGDKLLTDAAISTAETAFAAEDEALSTRITDLTATVSGEIVATAAAINSAETAYANEDEALATRITDLTATVSGDKLATNANINSIETAYADEDTALAGKITDLTATVSGEIATTNAEIETVESVLTSATLAAASRVDTLEAEYTIEDGSITGVSANSALKTTVDIAIATERTAAISSTTSLIAVLDNKTAGVTTQQKAEIDALTGKVNAQYTLEVNADGNVAGMKLGANAEGSSIAFTADSFKVSSEDVNGTLLTPFSIVNGQVAFNGAVSFTDGPQGPAGDPGVSSYTHIAYANQISSGSGSGSGAVDASLFEGFSTTDSYNKEYIGQFTSPYENTQSTNYAESYNWSRIKGADGTDGVQGAAGSKGSDGSNYRAVNLVATSYVVPYRNDGDRWFSNDINVKAKVLNTVGTVYYTFLLNDEVVQGPSTEIIYEYTPPAAYADMPDTIEVEIREGSGTSAVLARDQTTMAGLQSSKDGNDGIDAITVVLTNEAHSLPTTKDGVVNYDGSGTGIYVYEGVNQLTYDGSGTDEKTWKVKTATSNITRGTLTDSGWYVTVGKHKEMDANTASITYTIYGRRADDTPFEFTKVQTFAKSIEGQTGAQGDKGLPGAQGTDGPGGAHARAVNLTSGKQVFFYNTSGATPSPATTVITATPLNTTGTPYYRFYKNDVLMPGGGTSSTYTYTPNASFLNMPDKIEVEMREGNNNTSTAILARDQITMSAIKNVINGTQGSPGTHGVNGITVILSNEAHTLPVTIAGVVSYTGSGTKISVYEGATELSYNGSGSSLSTWKITSGQTNITRSTTLTDNGKSLTVGNHSGMNADTATITYTISGRRANGDGFTFTKVQTFAKSKTGATGAKGAKGTKGDKGSQGTNGSDPDTSQFLTQSTLIDGATIETGILKNGNFEMPGFGSGAGAGALATAPWNTYSTAGMGINLDKGAINAKNFYIDPAGNAKFRGDMDIEGNATIGGELASNLFAVEPESTDTNGFLVPRKLKFKDDVFFGDTQFNDFTADFSTIAGDYANRFDDLEWDDGDKGYSNDKLTLGVTLSHNYIKRNDTQIEVGDLVKLNESNELVRASSAQDNTIVGILWRDIDFTIKESPLDKFLPKGKDTSEKPQHYRDSLGTKIPVVDRDIKTIWKVASIGDSREGTLTGMKACDQNGLILTGDLVCSSDTPGYVMKQPVDYVIVGFENEVPIYEERQTINSFTVGKCMEDCAFDTEGKAEGIYGYLYCG